MPSEIKTIDLQQEDRVAVVVEGQIVKMRIAEVLPMGRFRLTASKDDPGFVFLRAQIFPLYRYVATPFGTGCFPLCAV